jgi:membrane protease subunit (stomatin/prohibitin family)
LGRQDKKGGGAEHPGAVQPERLKYCFESPFKADVYFVGMKQFTGFRWGTANPILMRDAEFGGARLTFCHCPQCGESVTQGAKFCVRCGQKL